MIEVVDRFPRGGIIRLALNFSSTDGETPADIELVEIDMRFAGKRPEVVTETMPLIATFAIELRGAGAGWFATITDTADLELGYYVADPRLTIAGLPYIGLPLTFEVTEAVTRRPA